MASILRLGIEEVEEKALDGDRRFRAGGLDERCGRRDFMRSVLMQLAAWGLQAPAPSRSHLGSLRNLINQWHGRYAAESGPRKLGRREMIEKATEAQV